MTYESDERKAILACLKNGEMMPNPGSSRDEPIVARLKEAIRAVRQQSPDVGPADLAGLLGQFLRSELVLQTECAEKGPTAYLSRPVEVADGMSWPARERWGDFGIEVRARSSGLTRVRAKLWQPRWLVESEGVVPDWAALAKSPRRDFDAIDADPFLQLAGHAKYRCSGQRTAVRSVLTAPPGASLVINLPTGAGKSLCALVPALLDPEGLCVVIVPTVALCIDQERAINDLQRQRPELGLPPQTAYYGGQDADGRREHIRRRIDSGEQRIVFVSPESFLGSLRPALYRAAKRKGRGRFRFLVLDEAHLVNQWGDEFRPAFQLISGMRRNLMQCCPTGEEFRTLLLSATITPQCLDVLETLFGGAYFAITGAIQLRPEPSYWFSLCENRDKQDDCVLEALRHLPRPLVLYTLRVPEADRWHSHLYQQGFRRIGKVTGRTPNSQREKVITDLLQNRIDIVVATSAFGLGVDNSQIRSIVHACVPENLDRYYQEVGRAGRDGCASTSVVVYTADDLHDAKRMNRRRIITASKGIPRWKRMRSLAEPAGNGLLRVFVNRGAARNRRNLEWDIRTLTLLARAGIITLDGESPVLPASVDEPRVATPLTNLGQEDTDEEARREMSWVVRENPAHIPLTHSMWDAIVEPEREKTRKSTRKGYLLMRRVLEGKRCVAYWLNRMYTLPDREFPYRRGMSVSSACGGCPACRRKQRERVSRPMIESPLAWEQPPVRLAESLQRLLRGLQPIVVFTPSEVRLLQEERLYEVLLGLARLGVQMLQAPQVVQREIARRAAVSLPTPLFIESLQWRRQLPRVASAVVYTPEMPIPENFDPWMEDPSGIPPPPRVLFMPEHVRDPRRPERLLRDMLGGVSYGFDEFKMEIGV